MIKFVKKEPPDQTVPVVRLSVFKGAFDSKIMGFTEYASRKKKNETLDANVVHLKTIEEALKEAVLMCSEHGVDTVYIYDPKNLYDFTTRVKPQ